MIARLLHLLRCNLPENLHRRKRSIYYRQLDSLQTYTEAELKVLLETPSTLSFSVLSFVFVRKCQEKFTLNNANIFSRLFENNRAFGRCKVQLSSALCQGRSNIFCHVVSPPARASVQITQRLGYNHGNCLDSKLSIG